MEPMRRSRERPAFVVVALATTLAIAAAIACYCGLRGAVYFVSSGPTVIAALAIWLLVIGGGCYAWYRFATRLR